ncbi:probable G-protein coupled receptor No18 [Diadema setosum]|uniref:probable G-protein coupled receptor No18 n=1 Tax=Diadema setosum TaxID=31175 RepID=UPI003B3B99B1
MASQPLMTTDTFVTGNFSDGVDPAHVVGGQELGNEVSIVAVIFLPLLIIMGVVGNALVCVSVIKIHKLRTVANSFVVSLAISDLAVCVIVLPFGLYEAWNYGNWHLGDILCNTWLTLDVILSTASVWNLCVIAGDRWLAITKPIWYANRRSAKLAGIAITIAWAIPALLTIPSIIIMHIVEREEPMMCYPHVDPHYIIFMAIAAFFLPCFIVLAVYIRIFIAARDHFLRKPSAVRNRKQSTPDVPVDRAMDSLADSSGNANACSVVNSNGRAEYSAIGNGANVTQVAYAPGRKTSSSATGENSVGTLENRHLKRRTSRIPRIHVNREKKAAIVLSIVVGAFIICWLPYFTAVLLYASGLVMASKNTFVAFAWLGWLNSIINPIIYTVFNRDFRKAFKYVLKCECSNWIGNRWSSTSK